MTRKRDLLILKILEKNLKICENELMDQTETLSALENRPVLERDYALISSISHTVGYLESVTYNYAHFIKLLQMNETELNHYIAEQKRIDRQNKNTLKKFFDNIIEARKI